MLRDTIQKLRKPLAIETKLGFDNTSVIGGLDEYMRAECESALLKIDGANLPQTQPFFQELLEMWIRYTASDLDQRREIVEASKRLLNELQTLATATDVVPSPHMSTHAAPQTSNQEQTESAPHFSSHAELPGDDTSDRETNGISMSRPIKTPNVAAPSNEAQVASGGPSLDTDLTYLKGIGPKRAEALGKLGIRTVYDLLYYFPARYEDRRTVKPIASLEPGQKESVCATVTHPAQTRRMGGRMGGNRNLTRVRVGDGSGTLDLQWWNQPFREKQFQVGMQVFLFGKISEFNGILQMDSPEFEMLDENNALQVGRIVPVYPLAEGLFQTALRRAIGGALERCGDSVEEVLPNQVRQRFELRDLHFSLKQIHFPDDWDLKEAARERLVFEELFLLQVALAQKKMMSRVEATGIRHDVPEDKIKQFLSILPFKLTGAQRRVMNEIRRDLKNPRPMNRLLHGDVGSGKTIVAAYALWTAHATGHQGALLAPTEILAEQHFSVLTRLLKPLGIEVALLEGSLKAAQKRRIQADISEGRTTVIVGTHALIQEGVEFNRLGVCVVDEQHRFGVMQRAALQQKGQGGLRPDVMVMTATPIPRTMALTVYGDLDVSTLDELPPGRQPIKTVAMKPQSRARAYKIVIDEVKKGRQAYVVCPLVEESEKLAQLQAATALAQRLRHEELHDLRVGLLHGQMSVVERDEEMELFRVGMRDVLVSTTVIEVGVDVPNATVMLVEDAERFGLSQLHQLRGRVGRGEHPSTCVLLGNPKTEEGRARISVMTKTQDGFEIAEHDLQLRGPGEFYGTRQSGMPDFRLANIIRDVETIAQAREAAFELVAADPHLEWDEHQALKHALLRFWGDKLSLIQVS